jgi:hypothetical protein
VDSPSLTPLFLTKYTEPSNPRKPQHMTSRHLTSLDEAISAAEDALDQYTYDRPRPCFDAAAHVSRLENAARAIRERGLFADPEPLARARAAVAALKAAHVECRSLLTLVPSL